MEEGYIVEPEVGGARTTRSSTRKATKKKVVRRDPDKRRLQNRLAQKTYREKQRKRIEDLERRAEASAVPPGQGSSSSSSSSSSSPNDLQLALRSTPVAVAVPDPGETVNPALLQSTAATHTASEETAEETWDGQDLLLSTNFDQWLVEAAASEDPPIPAVVFFDCGCPVLHAPVHPASVLLPVIPDPRMNALRIDIVCSIQALIDNCLQVGITRAMFCSDDAVSPFYRARVGSPEERAGLVASVQRGFRGLRYDLRPTRAQVTACHHPFIDAIPFRDVRDNLIRYGDEIDEDEFFHDSLNHMTCWGSVKGAHTGSPWDSRSWEASELFLQKWWVIVGGEDGELTRQSRWWRSLRGERVTEVL